MQALQQLSHDLGGTRLRQLVTLRLMAFHAAQNGQVAYPGESIDRELPVPLGVDAVLRSRAAIGAMTSSEAMKFSGR